MELRLFLVNAGDRDWNEWLRADISEEMKSYNFFEEKWYRGRARFLVLIHLGDALPDNLGARRPDEVDGPRKLRSYGDKWLGLEDEMRRRVWWLFYSGSGYHRLGSEWPNVHLLRYPVGDKMEMEKRTCFNEVVARLAADETLRPDELWKVLYPPAKMTVVTLLAILSAAQQNVDIGSAVGQLLADEAELRQAYKEFEVWAHRRQGGPSLSFNQWTELLRSGDYKPMYKELRTVLGAVPD